jgi:DNA-binding response OmpR family regulator
MILIVSSQVGEADALATLCNQRNWTNQVCQTFSTFVRAASKLAPRVVVTRQRLEDGYSDDILAQLGPLVGGNPSRVVVLASADCTPKEEARQLSLGADQVLRDPVRIEVLVELLQRHQHSPRSADNFIHSTNRCYEFAGAQVSPHELRLLRGRRSVTTTLKVIELVQTLHRAPGQVVPYTVMYEDLFGRQFNGDTANCRVLLGKAAADFRRLGLDLRAHIEVIPKSGYRYKPAGATRLSPAAQGGLG